VARKYVTEGVILRSRCPDVGSPNQWHAGDAYTHWSLTRLAVRIACDA
jgi:hypothetical protein